ncbi:type II toxin-antitoxin system VapC family toxin [Halalkalicoccus sp. NIPERK01]|uniref:type II toxin-antitoxin system VapC family toxin n=1 Tax=Halalkalicoccus sp. NIPERK01 TaxID=3053469 RepID=UPI00256EBF13|nr:PIN domain-containing protein [Halalkalicoccus sp. NIPERK01]MDL5362328.1 PIN domain-containing protein [Halalkalicoccus sp. NIPERK01]
MTTLDDRFRPDGRGAAALFLDSSAIYAYFYPRDELHDDARSAFEAIRTGELPYRPLYTNDYVLDEAVTRLRRYTSHAVATDALTLLYSSDAIRLRRVTDDVFDDAVSRFERYDDHGEISFTDHVIAAHADALGIHHVYTYDGDFDAFGLTVVPHYVE